MIVNGKTQGMWPTWMYEAKVETHEEIYKEFSPCLDDDSFFEDTWIYGSCRSSIRSKKNDALPWQVFFENIRPYTQQYFDDMQPMMPYSISCEEFWVNTYKEHDYQEIHDHAFPGSTISAVYILELPEGDDIGGQLVLDCPNYNIIQSSGMEQIFNQWQYQRFIPELEPGKLILFPSWIPHYVLPNKTNKRRATIAANFKIEAATHDETERLS